jgi:hypothetical protein
MVVLDVLRIRRRGSHLMVMAAPPYYPAEMVRALEVWRRENNFPS